MTSLPTRRLAELVFELGDEEGRNHGWKKRVAERLGVSPSYVSRILAAHRREDDSASVSQPIVDRVCSAMNLAPRFFATETGSYRDFLLSGRARNDDRSERWTATLGASLDFFEAYAADLRGEAPPSKLGRAIAGLLAAAERSPLVTAADALRRAIESGAPESEVAERAFDLAQILKALAADPFLDDETQD